MAQARPRKAPFDIDEVMRRLREAVRHLRKASMHQLADDGFSSVFEQLTACIISVRTREETTDVVARRLFAKARTPQQVLALDDSELGRLLHGCTFWEVKLKTIREIARRAVEELGGEIPCDRELLLSFKGVGPKCANLVLSVACGEKKIGVDIHVHRVVNRWGYVEAPTPEKTLVALERTLPRRYWSEINPLLVIFGRTVCTGRLPRCSTCPLLEFCRQVGVERHR